MARSYGDLVEELYGERFADLKALRNDGPRQISELENELSRYEALVQAAQEASGAETTIRRQSLP
jgi:hypothetical protein